MPSSTFKAPPCLAELKIIFQDQHLVVVNKPSGLLSVPGRLAENHDSVASRLQASHGDAHIVHRLDMSTSGLMVVALTKAAQRNLNQQFASRLVDKEYEAIVYGKLNSHRGTISEPLICDWEQRPRQKIDHQHGKKAITHYQVISEDDKRLTTRVNLRPVTGRSHQLRVHMMALGHPICGCEFYAHSKAKALAKRLQLHATQLVIAHPATGKPIKFISSTPF